MRLLMLCVTVFGVSLPGAVAAAGDGDLKRGSTLMGCLEEASVGGFVISDGTIEGVAVVGPEDKLQPHIGHWVKLDGESFHEAGKEHFRARTVTHMSESCDDARTKWGGAVAGFKNPEGETVGEVRLNAAAGGGVLFVIRFDKLPQGEHALHIHETGSCRAPSFESAGGHFNPTDASHGYLHGASHHAGDLPNFEVGADGTAALEIHNAHLSLTPDSLLDADSSAIVVHSGADDYRSQPSGDAGDRIACAVIESVR